MTSSEFVDNAKKVVGYFFPFGAEVKMIDVVGVWIVDGEFVASVRVDTVTGRSSYFSIRESKINRCYKVDWFSEYGFLSRKIPFDVVDSGASLGKYGAVIPGVKS